jgi:hypothetical protein
MGSREGGKRNARSRMKLQGVHHQAGGLRRFCTDVGGDPEDVTLLSVDNWGVRKCGLEPRLAAQNKAGESTDVKVMGPLLLGGERWICQWLDCLHHRSGATVVLRGRGVLQNGATWMMNVGCSTGASSCRGMSMHGHASPTEHVAMHAREAMVLLASPSRGRR